MTNKSYRLTHEIDPANRLMVFTVSGKVDSSAYIDDLIAISSPVEDRWLYDQIYDYREMTGLIYHEDLARLQQWLVRTTPPEYLKSRIVVISHSHLEAAAGAIVTEPFPNTRIYHCNTLEQAWQILDIAPGFRSEPVQRTRWQ